MNEELNGRTRVANGIWGEGLESQSIEVKPHMSQLQSASAMGGADNLDSRLSSPSDALE